MNIVERIYPKVVTVFAVLAVISCNKLDELQYFCHESLTFSSEMLQQDAPVKTLWNGKTIIWSEGDRIGVTYESNAGWGGALQGSEALDEDCHKAIFRVSVAMPPFDADIRFHAVYPYSAVTEDVTEAPNVQVAIPEVQTPSSASFDPAADLMIARSYEVYNQNPSDAVHLLWTRLVAHLDLTMKLPQDAANERLKSVTVAVNEETGLAGKCTLDLSNNTLTPRECVNSVTLNVDKLPVENGSLNVWAAVLPCKVSTLTVRIETDKAVYERKALSHPMELKANVRGKLSVDMSSAKRTSKIDPAKNALINERLFEVLDFDLPELAYAKELYLYGDIYGAAQEVKSYYATRTNVAVPLVDLTNAEYYSFHKSIADQALKKNGYRFFIATNYVESTSSEGDVYYSFLDEDGGVDWDYRPTTEDSFPASLWRHPWVEYQALLYWCTKDEEYVKCIVDVYSDWLETYPCTVTGKISMSNPDYRRWCQLQASNRISNYLKVLEYCKLSENLTPEFLSDLLVSLYDCVECIRANYYYSEFSNIRLLEVQAVMNMAVMMPEFKKVQEWQNEALSEVNRLLGGMLADDGVDVEMDPSYHIGVISIFYTIHQVLAANGKTDLLPSDYFAKLKKGVYFIRDLMYPDYSVEDFNDTRSSSWTKSVLTKHFATYQYMFPDDPTLEWFATDRKSGSAPTEQLSIYSTSGYSMLRTGWMQSDMMMVLKNNANPREYAHCQNDNGTISLYRNGRHFLPDTGVYTYGGSDADDALREQFRATKMHNTLTLDGANSVNDNAQLCGVFKKSAETDVYDMVHVSNQSYKALNHERHVYRIKDGFFVIVDQAFGSATGNVELNWHMAPGTMDYIRQSDSYEARTRFSDGNNMTFRTFCFNDLTRNDDFSVTTGTSWHSDLPGRKYERPCYTVCETKTAVEPARFITVICPFANSSDIPNISANIESANQVTVTVGTKGYLLTL